MVLVKRLSIYTLHSICIVYTILYYIFHIQVSTYNTRVVSYFLLDTIINIYLLCCLLCRVYISCVRLLLPVSKKHKIFLYKKKKTKNKEIHT